jgi:hypothetical protein
VAAVAALIPLQTGALAAVVPGLLAHLMAPLVQPILAAVAAVAAQADLVEGTAALVS